MDVGRQVNIKEDKVSSKIRTKQKVNCFFVRESRYEPIEIKDGSAMAFMSKMASGNPVIRIFLNHFIRLVILVFFKIHQIVIILQLKKPGIIKLFINLIFLK